MNNNIINNSTQDEIRQLCLAIIKQALDDYTDTLVTGKNFGKIQGDTKVGDIRNDIENFFNSEYFDLLTSDMNYFNEITTDDLIRICNKKAQYKLWRKYKGCSNCNRTRCIHKCKITFTNPKICSKDNERLEIERLKNEIFSNG